LEKVSGRARPEAFQCRLDPVVWDLGKPEFEREKHKVFNRNLVKYFLEN
jgi:hypothetical protein